MVGPTDYFAPAFPQPQPHTSLKFYTIHQLQSQHETSHTASTWPTKPPQQPALLLQGIPPQVFNFGISSPKATTASFYKPSWHPSPQFHAQGPVIQNQQQRPQLPQQDFVLYPQQQLHQSSLTTPAAPPRQNMDFLNPESFADPVLFADAGSDTYDLTTLVNPGFYASPEQVLLTSFDGQTVSPALLHSNSPSSGSFSNPPSGAFSEPFFSPQTVDYNDIGGYHLAPLFDSPMSARQSSGSPNTLNSSTDSLNPSANAQRKGHVRKTSIQKAPTFKKARKGKNKDLSYDPNDESSVKRYNNSMAARQSRARREQRMNDLVATVDALRDELRKTGYAGPLLDQLIDNPDAAQEEDDRDE